MTTNFGGVDVVPLLGAIAGCHCSVLWLEGGHFFLYIDNAKIGLCYLGSMPVLFCSRDLIYHLFSFPIFLIFGFLATWCSLTHPASHILCSLAYNCKSLQSSFPKIRLKMRPRPKRRLKMRLTRLKMRLKMRLTRLKMRLKMRPKMRLKMRPLRRLRKIQPYCQLNLRLTARKLTWQLRSP